jgi:hypothetical protein
MKRITRAKSKTLKLLVQKLEAQAGGPVTVEYLRLADLVTMLLGIERKYNRSTGGHTGRPPNPEDTRSARERILDDMSPEKRKMMKHIWEAEDEERAQKAQAQAVGEQS